MQRLRALFIPHTATKWSSNDGLHSPACQTPRTTPALSALRAGSGPGHSVSHAPLPFPPAQDIWPMHSAWPYAANGFFPLLAFRFCLTDR